MRILIENTLSNDPSLLNDPNEKQTTIVHACFQNLNCISGARPMTKRHKCRVSENILSPSGLKRLCDPDIQLFTKEKYLKYVKK